MKFYTGLIQTNLHPVSSNLS